MSSGTWQCGQGASPSQLGTELLFAASFAGFLLFCCYSLKLFPQLSQPTPGAHRVLVLLKLGEARAAPAPSCDPPASLSWLFFGEGNEVQWDPATLCSFLPCPALSPGCLRAGKRAAHGHIISTPLHHNVFPRSAFLNSLAFISPPLTWQKDEIHPREREKRC